MANKLVFGERRLHKRKACTFAVDIDDYNRVYRGHLRDLSLGGALIKAPSHFRPHVGKELMLTIPFRNKGGVVTIKGKINGTRNGYVVVVFLR